MPGPPSDCDDDGVPDGCDLLRGDITDADGNGIADECERTLFHRGDVDLDGRLNLTDAVSLLSHLFQGRRDPACQEAADVDNDGSVVITDAILILQHLFAAGPAPAAPGPPGEPCGEDPDPPRSAGDLGCFVYERC